MSHQSFWAACKRPGAASRLNQQLHGASGAASLAGYPEAVNLPFNRQALPDGFVLHPTPQVPPVNSGFWILLQAGTVLLKEDAEQLALHQGRFPGELTKDISIVTFATLNGQPVHAATIPAGQPVPAGLVAEPFNAFRERIKPDIMTMAGIGKQILHWQQMSRFCSHCNGQLLQLPETWGKKCAGCGNEHFPHIHPCAIVLIRRDDQLLLIRKPEWPIGRYSLVAGFLDMGESLEECAIREAMEETGISIKNVRYVASQAWPFPSQVMMGFVADYASGDIKVDGKEIDDARWFTIGSLPSLPASRSIARFLIDTFGTV